MQVVQNLKISQEGHPESRGNLREAKKPLSKYRLSLIFHLNYYMITILGRNEKGKILNDTDNEVSPSPKIR